MQGVDFSAVGTPILDAVTAAQTSEASCLWLSPGDESDSGKIRYVPLMAKTGDAFIDACIDALDALVFGPGARDLFAANPEQTPQATDIADIDLNLFKDARPSNRSFADPNRVHATAKSDKGLADDENWKAKAAEYQVAIHGNSVTDYLGANASLGLEDGQFLDREITICHARFNEGTPGSSQWSGGTVYWAPNAGYQATSGPDAGKVSAPFVTLGHELTHGWMDHFTDLSGNMNKRFVDQADYDISENTKEEGQVDYAALRALWDPAGEAPYSDVQFEAMVNAYIAYDGSIGYAECDKMIAPPLDLDDPVHKDTRIIGYNEEEANVDLDFRTAKRAREWAETNNPALVEPGGALEHLGNRVEYYGQQEIEVEGPLSSKRR